MGAHLQDRKQHNQMERVPQFNPTLLQIITNVFVQIVVLLYLIDNNENTSWMILFGSVTGVLIEAWKVNSGLVFASDRSNVMARSPKQWILSWYPHPRVLFCLTRLKSRVCQTSCCESRVYLP